MNLIVHTPTKPGYSETFLNAHISLISGVISNIYGISDRGYYPLFDGDGKELFSTNKIINYLEAGVDRLFNESGIGYEFRKRKLCAYLKTKKIDFIISEYGPTGTYLLPVQEKTGIPIIPFFHGRDAYHHKTLARFGKKYKKLFNQAPIIFCVSNDMKRQLISLGADANKIIVNACSPNTNLFENKNKKRVPDSILSVGRFCGKKSPMNSIKSVELAMNDNPNISLTMVGDGPLLQKCIQYVDSKNLNSKILFVGKKTPEEVKVLMNNSSIFIQHSVRAKDGDSEGTPVSILEALACGLPVVSTFHAGIPDVIISNDLGYLVDEHDVRGMSERIIDLLKRKDLEQMRNYTSNYVLEKFNMNIHIDRINNALRKALNSPNSETWRN